MKIELYNDHFENAKRYQIPRAQLIIADIPYNIGINAYGSRSDWYIGGDNKNGESDKAGKEFFDTDKDFKIYNFFQFGTRLLRPEPKERRKSAVYDHLLQLATTERDHRLCQTIWI